jgi:hypothetical protein
MRAMRVLAISATMLLFVALFGQGACTSSCTTGSDCGSGFCLFAVGSGCDAVGHCGSLETCVPQATPLSLCNCSNNQTLTPRCAANNELDERTTMGACPTSTPDAGTK